jgi:hypothetical protein
MDRDWMNAFGYMAYQNEREQDDDRSQREEKREPAREGLPLNLLVAMSSLALLTVWAVFLI